LCSDKISGTKFRELLRLFALNLEAVKIAALAKISRNCVNRILAKIRKHIAEQCAIRTTMSGIVGIDLTPGGNWACKNFENPSVLLAKTAIMVY
jgi:hypothetical protein